MKKASLLAFTSIILLSCSGNSDSTDGLNNDSTQVAQESMAFETLTADKTGIDFYNSITENEAFNFYNYEYIYNGAGVAVGDINNDGLIDIYFTGNQVSDKLYLNKGGMVFEDITTSAFDENANEGWHTGVTMVDINGDGWLDIYVCRSGNPEDKTLLQNMLFVNNQNNTFTEQAAEYGLNVQRRSTQAAFFDYDKDGDLDAYVMNHPIKTPGERYGSLNDFRRLKKYGEDADVFLVNNNGKFEDKSAQVGIENNCFGLGLAIGDLNNDGYDDVYVSNDYQDPDFMYMNNGDGTFSEEIKERTMHISSFSMGNDLADFNNDGFMDVMTVDMASEDHIRSKRNMGGMSTKNFWDVVFIGFHFQYMFNALQMNNGDGTFTDVAQVAGVSKSDWSWAPLLADFDNDGKKDLFITNGYRREARDNDYNNTFDRKTFEGEISTFEEGLALMPTTKIFNYIYKNDGDIHFTKKTNEWKFDTPVNSNGAAFADLDNDGDLDLILNNMEETSFIMENKLKSSNNYVRFKVEGEGKNTLAIGTKITIEIGDEIQYHEIHLTRGYQSSVDPRVHFGIGQNKVIDRVTIEFPNGKVIKLKEVQANQMYAINQSDAKIETIEKKSYKPYFADIADSLLKFTHKEVMLNDFESEVLLPHKMSQLGPFISEGDVNNDGLTDIYISGSSDFEGELLIQKPGVGFVKKNGPWQAQKGREEMDSQFIDVDGDGDLDLYVVTGGNEYTFDSPMIYDQLYINDGNGNFTNESEKRLPIMNTSGQRIAAADYDNDGDIDIYVGGRQTPGFYPFAPRSFLLQNDGKGFFKDVTQQAIGTGGDPNAKSIMGPGMITDLLFDDIDGDKDLDLVMVGEWMPITFFENNQGKFTDVTKKYNPEAEIGWWYSISKGDFNGDGKNDYVAGNVGANNKFHPSKEKPLELYCHDFDENGTYDIVLAKYQDNICYPVRGRQCSSEQMPFIKEKFPTYADYASANIENIYGKDDLSKALHFSATNFESVILLSSDNKFTLEHLPIYAQLGPLNKTILMDVNGDGFMDIVGAGNNYSAEVETVRYDGGRGVVLLGNGDGTFKQLAPYESGFMESHDCKDMALVRFGNRTLIITVSNRDDANTFILK